MKGKILISTANLLDDEVFGKTIIYLVDEDEETHMGFIVNKPLYYRVSEATDLKGNFQLYFGGPVSEDRMFFIHSGIPSLKPSSLSIDGRFWFGGDFEELKRIVEKDPASLEGKIKFFAGYSGWGREQLREEIRKNFWYVTSPEKIKQGFDPININPGKAWENIVSQIDDKMFFWKNSPESPQWN